MSKTNVNDLFKNAYADGDISQSTLDILNDVDLGAQIQAGLGTGIDDITASETLLVTMLIDDSGSIRFAGNAQAIRDGHNTVVRALRGSKQGGNILIMTQYLNGNILFDYSKLDSAIEMDSSNYNPNLGTPLYDATVEVLGRVIAKVKDFEDNGVTTRSITLIMTDGRDEHSVRNDADDCKKLITDMLVRTEGKHIIAALGVKSDYTEFEEIFDSMGIPKEWVFTVNSTDSEIRRAFNLFSQSAIRASQNAGSFSQAALGGFGQ